MSEYLRKRFPLVKTSTAYISGMKLYALVRHDKPGIIATVELLPEDANAFREAVRNAMADAWDEAFAAGANADLGDWEHPPDEYTNPYREDTQS